MRIFDENDVEITSPDLSLGHLVEEQRFVAHHPGVEAVAEQWHYETTATYPNGGKDVQKVVDVPGVEAKPAWDEYETIQRYIPFTQEQLEAIRRPPLETRVETLEFNSEEIQEALDMLLSGVTE